jgi:hypothetical protein
MNEDGKKNLYLPSLLAFVPTCTHFKQARRSESQFRHMNCTAAEGQGWPMRWMIYQLRTLVSSRVHSITFVCSFQPSPSKSESLLCLLSAASCSAAAGGRSRTLGRSPCTLHYRLTLCSPSRCAHAVATRRRPRFASLVALRVAISRRDRRDKFVSLPNSMVQTARYPFQMTVMASAQLATAHSAAVQARTIL